jgi:hypothetical protein
MDCEAILELSRRINSLDETLRQMHGENNNIRKRLDQLEGRAKPQELVAPAPDPWEKATHILEGGEVIVMDKIKYCYCEHCIKRRGSIPLREVRTPGRKKGEFVPWIRAEHNNEILYRKLEADKPDSVTYINLLTYEEV